jgi:hypothetical protein
MFNFNKSKSITWKLKLLPFMIFLSLNFRFIASKRNHKWRFTVCKKRSLNILQEIDGCLYKYWFLDAFTSGSRMNPISRAMFFNRKQDDRLCPKINKYIIIPSSQNFRSRSRHRSFWKLKNGVFWDVTSCGSCKNRRFGVTQRLLHQGDKNRRTRKNANCN